MDETSSLKFSKSHAEFLQYLCNGLVSFRKTVIITGHMYVTIDAGENLEYVVNEKLLKIDGEDTVNYISNSFPCFTDKSQTLKTMYKDRMQDPDTTKLLDQESDSTEDAFQDVAAKNRITGTFSEMGTSAIITIPDKDETNRASPTHFQFKTDTSHGDLVMKIDSRSLLDVSEIKKEIQMTDHSSMSSARLQDFQGKFF